MQHSLVGCQLKHSEASMSGQQEKESKICEEKKSHLTHTAACHLIVPNVIHFSFEGCVRAQEASYRSLPDEMMNRIFIAVCEGQPAGLVALKFRGNKYVMPQYCLKRTFLLTTEFNSGHYFYVHHKFLILQKF